MDLKGLFLKHASTLRGYLGRKVRDPQLAADLVQESFLRLAERGRKEQIDNTPGYLYRVAGNLLVDHIRQEARRKTDMPAPISPANTDAGLEVDMRLALQLAAEMLQREAITVAAKPAQYSLGDARDEGVMTKGFAAVNV